MKDLLINRGYYIYKRGTCQGLCESYRKDSDRNFTIKTLPRVNKWEIRNIASGIGVESLELKLNELNK